MTAADTLETRRRELGDFLRAHRDRLVPESLGLPGGGRRRTPGLRREEVAQSCGMSATWYTWLEQGREVSASASALSGLARTLQLTPAERAYLFELAGKRDPSLPAPPDGDGMDVAASLGRAVAAIDAPAYILDSLWNARAWNRPAARLFVGWLDGNSDRNLLRYVFLSPTARTVIPQWQERARRVLAEFRADSSRHLQDEGLQALVEELRRRSPYFARCWREHDVVDRTGGERTFEHPRRGRLSYEQVGFAVATRPDFKLVMLVGPAASGRGLAAPANRRSRDL
ncbi:helix-turn-helix transcriptional regulator [Reyranella sp.]|uniref:helix-turn-helix transcriptional regulator n=1 Tax=Reyranella sp. TaxID=1929291 RepID=UPI003BACC4DA